MPSYLISYLIAWNNLHINETSCFLLSKQYAIYCIAWKNIHPTILLPFISSPIAYILPILWFWIYLKKIE